MYLSTFGTPMFNFPSFTLMLWVESVMAAPSKRLKCEASVAVLGSTDGEWDCKIGCMVEDDWSFEIFERPMVIDSLNLKLGSNRKILIKRDFGQD